MRAAAYGHTLGGAVGLAKVDHADGVTPEWLDAGTFEVWTPHGERPVRFGNTILRSCPSADPG